MNFNLRNPDMLKMKCWNIGFFVGNDYKSRDLSPQCFKSRDKSDFENRSRPRVTYFGIQGLNVKACHPSPYRLAQGLIIPVQCAILPDIPDFNRFSGQDQKISRTLVTLAPCKHDRDWTFVYFFITLVKLTTMKGWTLSILEVKGQGHNGHIMINTHVWK